MNNALCTIVSSNFLPYVGVLAESINTFCEQKASFYIIVVDSHDVKIESYKKKIKKSYDNTFFINEIGNFLSPHLNENIEELFTKYNDNALRWSIRPIIIKSLLLYKGYDKILYLDGDLWFVSKFDFLFDYLKDSKILLSPHWRPTKPKDSAVDHEFICGLTHGIFNTGFLGFSKDAIHILDWWGECCRWACEGDLAKGIWYDQKYMDLVPAYFRNEYAILDHYGCNVSLWNRHTLQRTKKHGKYYVNGHDLVFLHINEAMKKYAQYDEICLWPLVKEYMSKVNIFINSS